MNSVSKNPQGELSNEARIKMADEEIKIVKEFMTKVYFKGDDADLNNKQFLLEEIDNLETLKLDDDFFYHLDIIYNDLVKRQEENLIEYKKSAQIINENRQQIHQLHDEIERTLSVRIDTAINDYQNRIASAHIEMQSLEREISQSEDEVDDFLSKVCQASSVVKEDFERRIQASLEQRDRDLITLEEMKQLHEQTNQLVDQNNEKQRVLESQIKLQQKSLEQIEKKISQSLQPSAKQAIVQQEERRCAELQASRDKLDQEITRIKVRLDSCKLDNSIIEKRQMYFISQVASNYSRDQQIDQLEANYKDAIQQFNTICAQIEAVKQETAQIEVDIVQIRKKKTTKQSVNLFLSILIVILISFILYKYI